MSMQDSFGDGCRSPPVRPKYSRAAPRRRAPHAPRHPVRPTPPRCSVAPAAREFADATAKPPFLFDLGPIEGRKTVDQVQAGEVARPDVDVEDTAVPGGPSGQVSVRILRPK